VGFDCGYCVYFEGPQSWPDSGRVCRCSLHDVSLAVELRGSGYKEGGWFCRGFRDNGDCTHPGLIARLLGSRPSPLFSPAASAHFEEIKDQLQPDTLYGFYGGGGNLKEFAFSELRETSTQAENP